MIGRVWVWFLLALLVIGSSVRADDDVLRIVYREQVTAFFSEAKATFTFAIEGKEEAAGKAEWLLVAKGRVLASGTAEAAVAPDKPALVVVERTLPPLTEGVVFPLQLKISFREAEAKKPAAELTQDLWLFSDNPFANRQKALAALEIKVFDPVGETTAALEKLEVPCERLTNSDAIADLSTGVLLVGEGTSLKDYPSIPRSFAKLAARGVEVICLAPADGEIPLPLQQKPDDGVPAQISLRRSDVIGELDKRLAAPRWVADASPVRSTLSVTSAGEEIKGEIGEAAIGWPWVEIRYAAPGSRVRICGLGIIRDWERSPAPRYLLSRLLEPAENAARTSKPE
jgi:hypothetical protein